MCLPLSPPSHARCDAGPDEEQLAVRPTAALAVPEEPVIQPEPVRLVHEDGTEDASTAPARYDPDSPRRYQLLIPIRLPFALRPDTVAPPPYYPPPHMHCDGLAPHRDAHMAILRPILAGALRALLGPGAPVHLMVDAAHLAEEFDGAVVNDRETNFDLERGWWRDQYGREGQGVDAYWDLGDTVYVVQFFEFRVSWRVGAEDVDPPIVKLQARNEPDGDGMAVFDVEELPERMRLMYNRRIREGGDWD